MNSAENHAKLKRILDLATSILQEEFHKKFSKTPGTLFNQLKKKKGHLQNLKEKKKINSTQWNILFPHDHLVDSSKFDVSLLFQLLSEFCLDPPTNGWQSNPNASDASRSANVLRIVYARNDMQHVTQVTDTLFEKYWKKFESPIKKLGGDENTMALTMAEIKNTPILAKTVTGKRWGIFDPVSTFTGRNMDLVKLHGLMEQSNLGVAVCAFGGVGKTELGKAYCQKYNKTYDDNFLWINAESSNTIEEEFRNIAQYLERKMTDEDGNQLKMKVLMKKIYEYFVHQNCLFIFDNTRHYNDIKAFLPDDSMESRPKILITSQSRDWEGRIEKYELEIFTKDEAVDFLMKNLTEDKFDEYYSKHILAETLEYHPLALQISASFMKRRDISCKKFMAKFKENANEVLSRSIEGHSGYTKTVLTAFNTSISEVSNHEEGQLNMFLLNIMSRIDGKRMEEEILEKLCENSGFNVSDITELLEDNSLIQRKSTDGDDGKVSFVMHSLIQLVIRLSPKEEVLLDCFSDEKFSFLTENVVVHQSDIVNISFKEDITYQYVKTFLDALMSLYSRNDAVESIQRKLMGDTLISTDGNWIHHVVHLIKDHVYSEKVMNELEKYKSSLFYVLTNRGTYATLIDILKEYLVYEEKTNATEEMINTRRCIAKCYRLQGQYSEALKILNEITLEESKLSTVSSNLQTKHLIAMCILDQGRYAEALSIFEENLKSDQSNFGEKDLQTLKSKFMMAMCLRNQGHYLKSQKLFQEIHDIEEVILPTNETNPLLTSHMIGICLQDQGHYSKAYDIFKKNCELQIKILGPSHPSTLLSKHMIAIYFLRKGQGWNAFKIFEENYEMQKEMHGAHNPATIRSRHNMARCVNAEGKYEEALAMLTDNYEIQKSLLTDDHPTTLRTKHVMAMCLQFQGKFNEAYQEFYKLYYQKVKVYTEKNPSTLITRYRVCWCLLEQGFYQKAWEMLTENHEKEMRLMGPESANTLATRGMIAWCLLFCGKYTQAEQMFRDNYTIEKRKLGEMSPRSIRSRNMITVCMKLQGKRSEELEDENRAKDEELLINMTSDEHLCKHTVGLFMICRGDCSQALSLFSTNLESQKDFAKSNPLIIRAKYLIGVCHMQLGDLCSATNIIQDNLEHVSDAYDMAKMKHLIGLCYWRMGDVTGAMKLFEENLKSISISFSNNFRMLLTTQHIIAMCVKDLGDHEKSHTMLIDIHEKKKETFGESSPSTVRTMGAIGNCSGNDDATRSMYASTREKLKIEIREEKEDYFDECLIFDEYFLKPQELIGEMNSIYAQYMSNV